MPSSNNVHNAHMSDQMKRLHLALLEIVSAMNRARNDETLLAEGGVKLDRALMPLLVTVERFGPISVGDLADRCGRDYTTVSRQLKKLKEQGLVSRDNSPADQRVCIASITDDGSRMTDALNAARERLARAALQEWTQADLDQLVTLLERLTLAMREGSSAPRSE